LAEYDTSWSNRLLLRKEDGEKVGRDDARAKEKRELINKINEPSDPLTTVKTRSAGGLPLLFLAAWLLLLGDGSGFLNLSDEGDPYQVERALEGSSLEIESEMNRKAADGLYLVNPVVDAVGKNRFRIHTAGTGHSAIYRAD